MSSSWFLHESLSLYIHVLSWLQVSLSTSFPFTVIYAGVDIHIIEFTLAICNLFVIIDVAFSLWNTNLVNSDMSLLCNFYAKVDWMNIVGFSVSVNTMGMMMGNKSMGGGMHVSLFLLCFNTIKKLFIESLLYSLSFSEIKEASKFWKTILWFPFTAKSQKKCCCSYVICYWKC